MRRLPPHEGPLHPIEEFRRRVARLTRDGRTVGALLVRPGCYWTERGHLWWRRFGEPHWAAEVWVVIDGEFNDPFYGDVFGMELSVLLEGFARGTWRELSDAAVEYDLTWLDGDEAIEVARDEFGIELMELADL